MQFFDQLSFDLLLLPEKPVNSACSHSFAKSEKGFFLQIQALAFQIPYLPFQKVERIEVIQLALKLVLTKCLAAFVL
jgi:hypothetical protein